MTLEQLRILQQIVELGSLKRAAEALHKTQPALSMAIRKMEDEFGFQILDRSQYRLQLTSRGKTFYRQSLSVLEQSEYLKSLGRQLAQGDEPLFRLSYEHVCPVDLVMRPMCEAQKRFQATEFRIRGGVRFTSLKQINEDEADLGIGPWFHLFHSLGDLETLPLMSFNIVLVASPSLIDVKKIKRADDLRHIPVASIMETEFSFDNERLTSYQNCVQHFKTRDIITLKALLKSGIGWGLISRHEIEDELKSGELQRIILDDTESEFSGEVRAFRRKDKRHGAVAQYLWEQYKMIGNEKR
ncbi:LysR family transcriptional regulator [Pleionea sp. CnH1-48]|uniref:LysR family transcriptional regulator n=1 Tax=Pleionea sp. CnH1-48 TaxID=2954494 RepID=UPI002096A7E1|nr:LysR family transcriptional regulator [Pleionea sp. CnH1-48]MCO7225234.1 LysR family transcriptional regulator [Pleionea sp. CnH1-48]